jgi:orotidine-5'-phosphate decarboxylase
MTGKYFYHMKKNSRDFCALALDNVSSLQEIKKLVHSTAPSIGVFKVGLEQFTRFGTTALEIVRAADRRIFLDLKFHDIPNTVGKAVESACELGVDYLTIHTTGGITMMRAAKHAAEKHANAPKIIGVTVLTSIDEACLQNELRVCLSPVDYVRHLAGCAVRAGLDGIVCSAADLPVVKPLLPDLFEVITPGIRPAGTSAHDQKRIATPHDALKNGATLLVLGRAVTDADDPGNAAEKILASLKL